jgi:ubiquitin carboxyl-terminal hydrolase 9/24
MLKTPHFSTRMNALKVNKKFITMSSVQTCKKNYIFKEVSKLVEEAESTSPKKSSIPGDQLAEWLSDHQVLSVALEGNIDHVQYTDRIKGNLKFLFSLKCFWKFLFCEFVFHRIVINVLHFLRRSCRIFGSTPKLG